MSNIFNWVLFMLLCNRMRNNEKYCFATHFLFSRIFNSLHIKQYYRGVKYYTQCFTGKPDRGFLYFSLLYVILSFLITKVDFFAGMEPNEFTFATVLTSCIGFNGLNLGRQVHSFIIKTSFESHIYVGSSLLDMYAKAGQIHAAQGVFESLPERDVVSCTAIISGYAQLGLDEEALELFRRLQMEGMSSNYVTYASVLTALSGLAALDHGKQVHNHVLRSELPSYVVL